MNRSYFNLILFFIIGHSSSVFLSPVAAQVEEPRGTQGGSPAEIDPGEMIPKLREMLDQDPDNATGHLNLGALLLQKGDVEGAKKHLQRAVELAPESVEAHANLAVILEQEGSLEEAEMHFTAALQLFPENNQIRMRRAAVRNRMGRADEALTDLNHIMALEPKNIQALFGKGLLLAARDEKTQAIEVLRLIPERTKEPGPVAEAHVQIGQLLIADGKPDEATAELRQAVQVKPDLVEARLALGNALAEQGEFDEAAEEFSKVVSAQPDNQPARFGQSVALLMSEHYDEALAKLEGSADEFPDNVAFKHALARLLATCPNDSIRDGERALRLAEEVMAAQASLEHAQTYAMALAETQSFEEAARVQRELLEQMTALGGGQDLSLLQQRLAAYEEGRPIRAPWLGQG